MGTPWRGRHIRPAPGRPRSCASQSVKRERDGQTAKVALRSSISNASKTVESIAMFPYIAKSL